MYCNLYVVFSANKSSNLVDSLIAISGLHWKIPVTLVLSIVMILLYEYYTPGSKLCYWHCRRESIQGHTLSFVFKTNDHQVN